MRKFKTYDKVWFIASCDVPHKSNLYEGTIIWKVPKIRYDDYNLYHCRTDGVSQLVFEVQAKHIFKKREEAITAYTKIIKDAIKENKNIHDKLMSILAGI